jgi:hypothetical protein
MSGLSANVSGEEDYKIKGSEPDKKTEQKKPRSSKFSDLIRQYKRINKLTKYLIRIIAIIILAALMVGIYEIWF